MIPPIICKLLLQAIQIIIYRATKGKNFKPIKLEQNWFRASFKPFKKSKLQKNRQSHVSFKLVIVKFEDYYDSSQNGGVLQAYNS